MGKDGKMLIEEPDENEGKIHPSGSGLLPVIGGESRILVLGSFPGEASLKKKEYYGHPRNRFWYICEEVFGIPRESAYEDRIRCLKKNGIALWDVLDSCRRRQSSDTSISFPRPNPVPECLFKHPEIHRIILNGSTAGRLFTRSFRGKIPAAIEVVRMPSTSPANTRVTTDVLTGMWRAVLV